MSVTRRKGDPAKSSSCSMMAEGVAKTGSERMGTRRDLAARRRAAWAAAGTLECTTAMPPREAMALAMADSETVSMGEATRGTARGRRRVRRVERSTASAAKSM